MENWKLIWTKLVPLNDEEINKIPENSKGVYRLTFHNAVDDKYYVFYVGTADNLKEKLRSHLNETDILCIRNYIDTKKCFFRYSIITEEYVRNAAARRVYKYFEPPCNTTEIEGRDDIEINVN